MAYNFLADMTALVSQALDAEGVVSASSSAYGSIAVAHPVMGVVVCQSSSSGSITCRIASRGVIECFSDSYGSITAHLVAECLSHCISDSRCSIRLIMPVTGTSVDCSSGTFGSIFVPIWLQHPVGPSSWSRTSLEDAEWKQKFIDPSSWTTRH